MSERRSTMRKGLLPSPFVEERPCKGGAGRRSALSTAPIATQSSVLATIVTAIATTAGAALAGDLFSSPAFDPELYRPETLRQTNAVFDSWTVRCQELVPLRRRICNLISPIVVDPGGRPVGSVLMSTDDKGKPSMLIQIPPPVAVENPIVLSATISLGSDQKSMAQMKQKNTPSAYKYTRTLPVEICRPVCTLLAKLDSNSLYTEFGQRRHRYLHKHRQLCEKLIRCVHA